MLHSINALPGDGVTVTPKHVGVCFNVIFNIVFFFKDNSPVHQLVNE